MSEYDETSIRVLPEKEAVERFVFKKVEALAIEYGTSPEWLQRVFEAAAMVDVSDEYVVAKYLKHENLPISEELQAAHREICMQEAWR